MKRGFPVATLAVMMFLGATPSAFAAEETASPITANNLPATPKVPVTPVRYAAPAEIVQNVAPRPAVVTSADASVADDADFSTLDAAVAAQPGTLDATDTELECLAIGIYFESKGEPLNGQLAVADVILNRSTSGRFPESVCSVLKQPGQFSFVRGGRLPSVDTAQRAWKTAVAVARVATRDLWDSPAKGALFFHARHVRPNWGKPRLASIGNHIFYR